MTAKELMMALKEKRAKIKSLQMRIEELRKDDGYSSFDYSQIRVQTSPNGVSPQEKIATRIEELKGQLMEEIAEYHRKLDKVDRISQELGGLQGDYIFLRYVCNVEPEKIARELHYSVHYLDNINMVALREIDRRRLCD